MKRETYTQAIPFFRSQSLKDDIKRLQEKETRDTKALEEMIQKVEDNLKTATVRELYMTHICIVCERKERKRESEREKERERERKKRKRELREIFPIATIS